MSTVTVASCEEDLKLQPTWQIYTCCIAESFLRSRHRIRAAVLSALWELQARLDRTRLQPPLADLRPIDTVKLRASRCSGTVPRNAPGISGGRWLVRLKDLQSAACLCPGFTYRRRAAHGSADRYDQPGCSATIRRADDASAAGSDTCEHPARRSSTPGRCAAAWQREQP